jgi:hypothetical protein
MFLGKLPILIPKSGPPGNSVDQKIYRLREGRSTLDMMIANQMEGVALCKDREVIVDGPVAEVKSESSGNAVAVNRLG